MNSWASRPRGDYMDKAFADKEVKKEKKPGYDCSQPGVACFYNKQNRCVNCGNLKGWKRRKQK
jgi:hypothetical protein